MAWIDIDCNGDGLPDDIAGVKGRPCTNGLQQEFYGLDDECVLWTTNVFAPGAKATALGLGIGDDFLSAAWVATSSGALLRLDASTAEINADVMLPGDCATSGGPWGMTVDVSSIGWVTEKGAGHLCWLDTKDPFVAGVVRDPPWGKVVGDGLSMDRDLNLWIGGEVARYTPDRSNGRKNLGSGWWTRIDKTSGSGITADSRNANDHFVYSCRGPNVLQIPASTIKVMKVDQTVANNGWPAIQMPCIGVAVAWQDGQNIFGIDGRISTRAIVDQKGVITQPTVNGAPMGNNKCPAGDSCPNAGAEVYSDFAGFRSGFTRPRGTYAVLVRGCTDGSDKPTDTNWVSVTWDADVPPNTTLGVHARSANVGDFNDPAWGFAGWTIDQSTSPFLLEGPLEPNAIPGGPVGVLDGWLQVEFVLKTSAQNFSPHLRSFDVRYRCPKP